MKYGRIESDTLPALADALECDLETGSHHRNNAAWEKFHKEYPTIIEVAVAHEARGDRLENELRLLKIRHKILCGASRETNGGGSTTG